MFLRYRGKPHEKKKHKFSDPYTRGHLFYIQLKEGIKLGWKKNCYYEYLHGYNLGQNKWKT